MHGKYENIWVKPTHITEEVHISHYFINLKNKT